MNKNSIRLENVNFQNVENILNNSPHNEVIISTNNNETYRICRKIYNDEVNSYSFKCYQYLQLFFCPNSKSSNIRTISSVKDVDNDSAKVKIIVDILLFDAKLHGFI